MKLAKLLATYGVVIGIAIAALLIPLDTPNHVIRIDSAGIAQSTPNSQLSIDISAAQQRQLPDDWRRHQQRGTTLTYFTTFVTTNPAPVNWAVFIPSVRYNARVKINGQTIGDGGRMSARVVRNMRHPLYFEIPPRLLHAGENNLSIEVKSGLDEIGYLSKVYLGVISEIRPYYERHLFYRVTVFKAITVALFSMAILVGMLALIRRVDREYFWFTLATTIWGFHSFSYFVVDIPVSEKLWDWLAFVTIAWFSYFGGVIFIRRFLKIDSSQRERTTTWLLMACSFALYALPVPRFYDVAYYAWHPLCQVIGSYGLIRMFVAVARNRRFELHILLVSGTILITCAAHDLAVVFGIIDWGRGYTMHYSMALVLFVFGTVLIRRFSANLVEVETMRDELEIRVEKRRQELERTYEKLREEEKHRVIAEEHERIVRDMHDGVGGHLVSSLTLLRADEANIELVEETLQNALVDLRLTVDSLDHGDDDLLLLLGMFRSRIEPTLNSRHITLRWNVSADIAAPKLGPGESLSLLRVLQEFITNTVKHSNANAVTFSLENASADTLTITIQDNGDPLHRDRSKGRGMINIQRRASELGGELTHEFTPGGVVLRLVLGLHAQPDN